MKKLFLSLAVASTITLPVQAAYYITGDWEGWSGAGSLMTETVSGSGIWQASLSLANGRHEFKVTQGDWSWNVPGSGNSWLYTDGSGNVTITYDANTHSDGWAPASGRVGVNVDPGSWTAVGDWQGWNNSDASTLMTSMGGGVYQLGYYFATGGMYQYKAVNTGTWDAIGADSRGVNATTLSFTVESGWDLLVVNVLDGSLAVIPEPSTLALLGAGLAGLCWLRRKQ